MKISLLIIGIALIVLGIIFTASVIGAILGVPLLLVGLVVFIISLIWPIRI